MPVLKLLEKNIKNLNCPEDKSRVEYCCEDLPGFYVEVRRTEGKSYYYRYKDASRKTCHQKIGRTTDITLVEARKRAKTLKAEIALGADPRGEEKARLAVLTFSEFFEQHYLPYVKPRKRSWKRDYELYRLRIKAVFGHKRLNEITRQQVQSFHTALKEEGLAAATCNHHIKLMKHALNLAIDWGMLDKNPVARVPMFYEDNKLEHYMDDVELNRLLTVLHTDENRPICQIALFLLSTGCRLNEVLSAKWSDVDMSKGIFTIRATNAKSKKLRGVPLNESAIEILNQLDAQGKFEYLFVNRLTGMPYRNIHKVWHRLREKAGLKHLRLHDLRHQYASFLVNSGRTLYEVQQIFGHSTSVVTQRYSHLSTKVLNEAAQSASVKIKEATTNSM
ncbi:MAG: tyrosine-type recombinase/integrase [Nitrosomonas sp.]|uniref:tyrosine-type recombinase/integrase n=1 Tax=Nitrosomonas sp. TaxID=42353 RepID=UPI002749507D|nr:tyrosine-type recombinase/integrase [Nitrosomonas sp.]MDP3609443.1 tyrosine-type recombinase/integrase [Methylophilus sp.]MDZ4107345.1 tyrosine-type recombinase/integrase [Nitrosomonas sp.]